MCQSNANCLPFPSAFAHIQVLFHEDMEGRGVEWKEELARDAEDTVG